jgi:hypothetical protein
MKIVKTVATSALALVAVAAIAQSDQSRIRVVIDGERVRFSGHQPDESGGRVLVPLRGVFERLGAKVDWDPSDQSVFARKEGMRVKLAIGQLDASVNGQHTTMDVPATIDDGTTMVPLRFVSEALGAFVTWNPTDHEVDITSSTDYNLPKPEPPRRPTPPPPVQQPPAPIVITPPPPAPVVVDRRPLRVVNNYREIAVDTILPFVLESPLSSRNSKPGDPFSGTLDTHRAGEYLGLPEGTQVFGTVSFVRRQVHRDPGVIQLRFDHLVLPNGRTLPVNGKLSGVDDVSAMRTEGGRLVAKNPERNATMVFVADGPDTALVVGFPTDRPLGDGMIHNLLTASLDANQRTRLAHNAELPRGTRMGLRLYDGLIVPHD